MNPAAFFSFEERTTWFFRLDGRVKLFFLLGFSLLAVLFTSPLFLAALLFSAILLAGLAQLPARLLRPLFLIYYPLVLLLLGVLQAVFFYRPEAHGFFHPQGFFYGLLQALRVLAITTAGLVVIATTPAERLIEALRRLGLPYELCFVSSISLRILPIIIEEIGLLQMARKARGFEARRLPPAKKLGAALCILESVFLNSLHAAKDTALAVDLKAFRSRPERTFTDERQMNTLDWIVFAVSAAAFLAMTALYFRGMGR
jgi:energy-coupling factor transport system permease protein